MTQFSDLQDRVLRYGFADSKYRADVATWLNEAQRRIAQKTDVREWFYSIAFSTSDHVEELPNDFVRLAANDEMGGAVALSTDASDWVILEPLGMRDFDDAPVSYGTPANYLIVGTAIYLYPYPDSEVEVTVNYFRVPTTLEAGDDVPEIGAGYEDVLCAWALKRAYEREQDFEAGTYWGQEYNGLLSELMGQLQSDVRDGPRIVPGPWRWDGPQGMVIPR